MSQTAQRQRLPDEEVAFRSLSFIRGDRRGDRQRAAEVDCWRPLALPQPGDGEDRWTEAFLVGGGYALELVTHVKGYGSNDRLSLVMEAMVRKGAWTGIEAGFTSALDQFIAHGEVGVAGGFVARPIEPSSDRR